jgi:hypothetical protein
MTHSILITRLKALSRVTVALGVLVSGYLLLCASETRVVPDRQGALALIDATTNISELKARASALTMHGNNASHLSMVLIGIAVLALLLCSVLAAVSIRWLGRLHDIIYEKTPHT